MRKKRRGATHVDLPPVDAKSGFTLAEVLITLGIIGIVAAMTIPALMTNIREKQTVSKLKQTYSILYQAFMLAEEEYGGVSSWGFTGAANKKEGTMIANNLRPYLKISEDCGYTNKKNCIPNVSYKFLNGKKHDNYATTSKHYGVKLLNGTSVWWRGPVSSEISKGEYINVFVDVNGDALPNTIGKDMFAFDYVDRLYPEGSPESCDSNIETCKLSDNGWGCSYYIIKYGNMNYLRSK